MGITLYGYRIVRIFFLYTQAPLDYNSNIISIYNLKGVTFMNGNDKLSARAYWAIGMMLFDTRKSQKSSQVVPAAKG